MAPASLTPARSSDLGLPPNSYIYKIISTAPRQDPLSYLQTDQLAVISSEDSLHFLDPGSLNTSGVIQHVNDKVTCLERGNDQAGNIVATAGRDGLVNLWDKRSRQKTMSVEIPHKLISSIVCSHPTNFLAAGIENPQDGPDSSPVYIYDTRNPTTPHLSLIESHTDTVTTLQLHPSHPTLLLSSSTDGLINIFDTSKPDEDDALYQVINHRSAVAHAGFMFPNTDVYAMGTDETLSFYALQNAVEEVEEPTPKAYGDVRESFGCEYLARMHWVGSEAFVAAGKHSSAELTLYPVHKNTQAGPLEYICDPENTVVLPGAHGEEIVRDLFTDIHTRTTYTCGEDGFVRAWQASGDQAAMDLDESKTKNKKDKRKDKKEKRKGDDDGKKARFAPY
ncbi:unnamed protein product [Periconia digitata]|uniref:WD40 repeat-like protein n=1 Tax=Periconia digitata TaxID=1303443 RepID=A0A9W4XF86_9PLEO|nr:unnamed protein product [Periconia digitata]